MEKLHKELIESSQWYSNWHKNRYSHLIHWIILGTVFSMITLGALNLSPAAKKTLPAARGPVSGDVDTTFNTGILTGGNVAGSNPSIYVTAIQADGKTLIGGYFTAYNGISRNYIARLNTDGSLDTTFNPGTGVNNIVYGIIIQPQDKKIIITGNFTSYNGVPRNYIARLNTDGSLDTTFNPGTGANTTIFSGLVMLETKIVIWGNFTSYNGVARNRIARLNTDGSLDTTFNPGVGANSSVYTALIQPSSKLLIAGNFTSYNSTAITRIARINSNGSLDTTFNPGLGATGIDPNTNYIANMATQADGKIIIAGWFTSYNGVTRNRIARINTDGSLDTTFDPGVGTDSGIYLATVQIDNKILITGPFNSYNGTARNYIARLNTDGSLDTTFDPLPGANYLIYGSTVQFDDKILIYGYFTSYNGIPKYYIARINP